MDERLVTREQVVDILEDFINWLYDTCPVAPEEVTRLTLVNTYRQHLDGKMPTRDEVLPHTRISEPIKFKKAIYKFVK